MIVSITISTTVRIIEPRVFGPFMNDSQQVMSSKVTNTFMLASLSEACEKGLEDDTMRKQV